MSGPVLLVDTDRAAAVELAPVLRRAVGLDPRAVARVRLTAEVATVLVRLPFGVLVSRSVALAAPAPGAGGPARDVTVGAADLLAWVDADGDATSPAPRDADWRWGMPPPSGWRRLDTLPDDVIRSLVRQGAQTLQEAAAREGVPGAQPRQQVADTVLDSVVLKVSDAAVQVPVTLRALSALTRMGFLPRGGEAHVDVAGRWVRVVGGYGTVYLERPGAGLGVVRR